MIADVAGTAGKTLGWEWLGQMRRLECLAGSTSRGYRRVDFDDEDDENEFEVVVVCYEER